MIEKRVDGHRLAIWALCGLMGLVGIICSSKKAVLRTEYDGPAYRPQNSDDVRVKVSLQNRMVYVLEGDRPLLVTRTAVGKPETPAPRSHGCLRSHTNVAPRFFALVKTEAPVNLADSQPEDYTPGRNVARPQDHADSDLPISTMILSAAFPPPKGPLFAN